jgi:hypothetical protein
MEMNENKRLLVSLLLATGLFTIPAGGVHADDDAQITYLDSWSKKQMFVPSYSLLRAEAKGRITIVSSATDIQVGEFMDKHFNRIDNMMFVSTIVTNDSGEIAYDEDSGEPQVEDDECG